MKRMIWTLSFSFLACLAATAQDPAPAASLGLPRASLGLPRPSESGLGPVLPVQAIKPAAGPAAPAPMPLAPVASAPIVPAPDPVMPSPYRFIDTRQPMPNAEESLGTPIGATSPPTGGVISTPPPIIGDNSLCPLPANAAPFLGDHFRLSAEYLMWWTSGFHAPPLVTTGPATSDGIIGQPGVSTLAGGGRVSPTFQSGARFGFDWFFGPRQVWGLDGHFFFLNNNTTNQTFTSDQYPTLARPFFNLNQSIPFSEIVASPGLITGGVNIQTSTSLIGGDINLRRKLYQDCSWCIDVFGGYRYLNLSEKLSILEASTIVPGAALPSTIPANLVGASAFDQFKTTNQFNGGQIGANFECTKARWVLSFRPSIALGETHSTLDIIGGQTLVYTTGTTSMPGGLLALNSNIGHYEKNTFAAVPEATFNLGYNLTDHCRVFVGYNFLYWSSVMRPGAQINPNLDVNRIPGFPATNTISTVAPGVPLKDQGFFAQGVNFGFMFRW